MIDFDAKAADQYARICADRGIARADAMHLACAAAANVDLFLTNDHRLHDKIIPGIQFIGGLDVNVL
jgi:predicted nucleic acid-binding protein